jgi:hypothetical protein
MELAEIILVLFNLGLGLSLAAPLVKLLNGVAPKTLSFLRGFILFIAIYFFECVAIVVAMMLPIFSLGLSFTWGLILGLWLRDHVFARKVLKTSFFISVFTSLPAVSFLLVPLMGLFTGLDVLNAEEGFRFGIPDFLYWPFNTILGFYAAFSISLVILKTTITTGVVSVLIHLKQKPDNH